MTNKKIPLGTGFSPHATADDVLAGLDLSGINVVITGGHAGIGLEATRALSKAGAAVTVAARNPDRAAKSLAGIDRVSVDQLDLVDPNSIRAFVDRWLGSARPLHILINCAGVPAPAERVLDSRGNELQCSTNHLGHFQLTLGLLPALRSAKGARVVNVSSGAQRFGQIHWDDPSFAGRYDPNIAYAQSKLANVLFAVALDGRYARDDIHAYAVHPGIVAGTALNSSSGPEALRAMGIIDEFGQPVIDPALGKKTPQQGASTVVFAATSPMLANIGGVYLTDNDISAIDDEMKPMDMGNPVTSATSRSVDPELAERLWNLSEHLTGTTSRN